MISFTVDLEDPTGHYASDGRYISMTRRILLMCREMRRRATFFVVGRVAEGAPHLLRDIAAEGHEIAYHSHNHISLTEEHCSRFQRESREDKDKFEQLIGRPVMGFRAPRFSLTPQSVWALDILKDVGFAYSSSIMPTNVSRYGFPDAARAPFRWPNGLIEFPLPVADNGFMRLPYLGGIYLYALPFTLTKYLMRQADAEEVLWTYTHPYDFDREEKFSIMPGEPLWISAVLWGARRFAEPKIRKLLALGNAPTLGELAAKL